MYFLMSYKNNSLNMHRFPNPIMSTQNINHSNTPYIMHAFVNDFFSKQKSM